jgi:CRISPR/Cas system-associated protein Cas10 (large subunit of type III CRISPR-Cas system)
MIDDYKNLGLCELHREDCEKFCYNALVQIIHESEYDMKPTLEVLANVLIAQLSAFFPTEHLFEKIESIYEQVEYHGTSSQYTKKYLKH